jgi:hypothetical protein
LAIAAAVVIPTFASAENCRSAYGDPVLRYAELLRWKQLGMASVDDGRCKTARQAENSDSLRPVRLHAFRGSRGLPFASIINPQPTKQNTRSKLDPPAHG